MADASPTTLPSVAHRPSSGRRREIVSRPRGGDRHLLKLLGQASAMRIQQRHLVRQGLAHSGRLAFASDLFGLQRERLVRAANLPARTPAGRLAKAAAVLAWMEEIMAGDAPVPELRLLASLVDDLAAMVPA